MKETKEGGNEGRGGRKEGKEGRGTGTHANRSTEMEKKRSNLPLCHDQWTMQTIAIPPATPKNP